MRNLLRVLPSHRSVARKLMLTGLIVTLASCSDPKPQNGTTFACAIPPPAGSALAKFGGAIPLTDNQGRSQWCAPLAGNPAAFVPPPPAARCMTACTNGMFGTSCTATNVTALVGYPAQLPTGFVWLSDLQKNPQICKGGTITGPGQPFFHKDPTVAGGGFVDTAFGCIYNSMAANCDSTVGTQSPALGVSTQSFDNYAARPLASGTAFVQSDEASDKNGMANVVPGSRALSFNIAGNALHVTSFAIPFESFTYEGKFFTKGSISIVGNSLVAFRANASSPFEFAANSLKLSIIASEPSGGVYTISAKNSSALAIDISGTDGPTISGTISGSLEGHPLHADVHADFAWINRPPVAIAKASNMVFDSSTWRNATDHKQVCVTPSGIREVTWRGVLNAEAWVTLDASGSYDLDAADSIRYAWNTAPLGDNPIAYLKLGKGNHVATLTVQDDRYVSTVTQVAFEVADLATKALDGCGSMIGASYDPSLLKYRVPIGDPVEFAAVERSISVSNGNGVPVNLHSRDEVVRMGNLLGPAYGRRMYQTATEIQSRTRSVPAVRGRISDK